MNNIIYNKDMDNTFSIAPDAIPEKEEMKKSISVTKATKAPVSMFTVIPSGTIAEKQKRHSSKMKWTSDMMALMPGVAEIWKGFSEKFGRGMARPSVTRDELKKMEGCYSEVVGMFEKIVKIFESADAKECASFQQSTFSDEVMYVAALSIYYSYYALLGLLAPSLDRPDSLLEEDRIQEYFRSLILLHEFFFALIKFQTNTILCSQVLNILQESIKQSFNTLQSKIKNNYKLQLDIPAQVTKLRVVAFKIYYLLQTITVLSIFSEPEELTASKYSSILNRLQSLFILISNSMIFEKMFSENYDFEYVWILAKGKYVLSSFGQKRLSIFLQISKISETYKIEFSLKYVIVYYYYKILKLISRRVKIKYDEQIFSVFLALVQKSRILLGTYISHRDENDTKTTMMLINENLLIIKTYIVNLAFFSDNLDPMQRQEKYDMIKDIAIDCLSLAMMSGMFCGAESLGEISSLSIFEPQDFVALLFKSLLLYKKMSNKSLFEKVKMEMIKNVNILASDLLSRPIPTYDPIGFHSYYFYFFQFLSEWEIDDLISQDIKLRMDTTRKYSEEVSRVLPNFEVKDMDSDTVKMLKCCTQDLALGFYVKLSQVDCIQPIETAIRLIKQNFNHYHKLQRYYYMLLCLLSREKLTLDTFHNILKGNRENLKATLGKPANIKESQVFIEKDGISQLFVQYKNAICYYQQRREERQSFEEIAQSQVRKSIGSMEVDSLASQTHMAKLDSVVMAYEEIINITNAVICALHYSTPISQDFLANPEFDRDFYETVILLKEGRTLILNLIQILCEYVLGQKENLECVDHFCFILKDIFQNLLVLSVPFEEEKPFLAKILDVVERLICKSKLKKDVREILFHQAILSLYLDICKKDSYKNDVESFLRFLKLMKLIVKGNHAFYESLDKNAFMYNFIRSTFEYFLQKHLISLETIKIVLQLLISIAIEQDMDLEHPVPVLIYEPSAIETYFQLLVFCFKREPELSNESLQINILSPLEALRNSLRNDSILSKLQIQEMLMNILKRARDSPFCIELSSNIGKINSIHTTHRHIQHLLLQLKTTPHSVLQEHQTDHYLYILNTLIDSISGENYKSLYFFTGEEKSYIRLKTPLAFQGQGLCFTGHFRIERGGRCEKQCIFSFLKIKSKELRGLQLMVEKNNLCYNIINIQKEDSSQSIVLPNIQIREDVWYKITLAHIGKGLQVYLNDSYCGIELGNFSFCNEYNSATIGAAINPTTRTPYSPFFGEMTTFYFFNSTLHFRNAIKDIAHEGQYISLLFQNEIAVEGNVSPIYSNLKNIKYANKEFKETINFVVDPRYHIFSLVSNESISFINGKSINTVDQLNNTQLFFNRPAKDIFYNLGGFKTCLPLLASKLGFTPETEESDSEICNAILKLLHSLCLNKDVDVVTFIVEERGIGVLQYLFEKVGKRGCFSKSFVDILFKIMEILSLFSTSSSRKMTSLMVEDIIFNARIWSNSKYEAQIYMVEKAHDFIMQHDELPYLKGQPYYGALRMLFDYLAPAETEDPSLKDFLNTVRVLLNKILITYFDSFGRMEDVETLVEFLLPCMDYLYSIRDLLNLIMVYQTPPIKTSYRQSVVDSYLQCKQKQRRFGLILALLSIIHNSIEKKKYVFQPDPDKTEEASKKKYECYEHLISYSLHILFSINWTELYKESSSSSESPSGSPYDRSRLMKKIDMELYKQDGILSLLNPPRGSSRLHSPEEVILHFLFHRRVSDIRRKLQFEKNYLGEKVYHCLLSWLLHNPSMFYLSSKKNIVEELKKQEKFSKNKFELICTTLFENLRAFESSVMQQIVIDFSILISENTTFSSLFYSIDPIYEALTCYLGRRKFLLDTIVRDNLETFFLKFTMKYWRDKTRPISIFQIINNFKVEEMIRLNEFLIDILLTPTSKPLREEEIYNIIQFTYSFEDILIGNPALYANADFIRIFGKLLVYLSRIEIMGCWCPSFVPHGLQRDLVYNHDFFFQREGGIARVLLKILFIFIKYNMADSKQISILFNYLKFFIFGSKKTLSKIARLLKVSEEISRSESSFLGFNEKRILPYSKLLGQDKCVSSQKSVDDLNKITSARKDFYQNGSTRCFYLITELIHLGIYSAYKVSSYRDISFFNEPEKVQGCFLRLIGKILKFRTEQFSEPLEKFIEEQLKELQKVPYYPIEKCLSSIDTASKEMIDVMRPSIDYAVMAKTKSFKEDSTPSTLLEFREGFLSVFSNICEYYYNYKNKKISKENYDEFTSPLITNKSFIKTVQSGLHMMCTEDLLFIDKMIMSYINGRPKKSRRKSHPKTQTREDRERIENIMQLVFLINRFSNKDPFSFTKEESINEIEFKQIKKKVLSEKFFKQSNKDNEKLFELTSTYYQKLLNRCPLWKTNQVPQSPVQFFVELDLTRDNLDRAMRLKPMKRPLENPSMQKGLAYVKAFFLKKMIILSFLRQIENTPESEDFLFPSKYHKLLLNSLLKKLSLPIRLSTFKSTYVPSTYLSEEPDPFVVSKGNSGAHTIKTCTTRTQLFIECKFKQKIPRTTFPADMIIVDLALFGELQIFDHNLTFIHKRKDLERPDYRLGPSEEMSIQLERKFKKTWRFMDIKQIQIKEYNMIKQAIEILLKNHKSIFLVFFSEAAISKLFSSLEYLSTHKNIFSSNILINEVKKNQKIRKYQEYWKKNQISNFEYLIKLNDYSSRSFQDLSQYPVFPWVIQTWTGDKLEYTASDFRNLSDTVAGITPKKKKEADKKFENTEDIPGGRFQFGAHYMPGRAVLGYLMRIQPYTYMIFRFDSGGDCPSRHFHIFESMWQNILGSTDFHVELIPEFFYNPEFLINHNKYSFGLKVFEESYKNLKGTIVRVDSVILPSWAKNPHHYIYSNYVALEHPIVRSKLHNWIDLIFGDKQHKEEYYNLFKPLTYGKIVKEIEEGEEKLSRGDISQISEFGHDPVQIFDKPHVAFDPRMYDTNQTLFGIYDELKYSYLCVIVKSKDEIKDGIIRVLPKDKNGLYIITGNYSIIRKQINIPHIFTPPQLEKFEMKSTAVNLLFRFFNIYDFSKESFVVDPMSVFSYSNNLLISCRNNENIFFARTIQLCH